MRVLVCDGVNGGCCQLHSGVALALGKAQHALLQVCVWVCVCFCAKAPDSEMSRCHYGTTARLCCRPLWPCTWVFNPQFDKRVKSFTQRDDWTTAKTSPVSFSLALLLHCSLINHRFLSYLFAWLIVLIPSFPSCFLLARISDEQY